MKKLLPILFIIIIAVGAWVLTSRGNTPAGGGSQGSSSGAATSMAAAGEGTAPESGMAGPDGVSGGGPSGTELSDDGDIEVTDDDMRPAAQRYRSAEEALTAIKTAAISYDDLVLEQFTTPGEDCSWCPQFYQSVKELLISSETKPDQRSYYAEILAISGKTENLSTLLEFAKNAPTQEERDIYTEAIELTVGKDDVTRYLGDQITAEKDNPGLKESLIAAVTNQGSRMAAETLYKQAVEAGDPDGYYSVGIGLGELVPEQEALPYLHELAIKRDAYSHLAVKSLLNSGVDGLRIVFDVLANSKDAEFDRRMLKDAVDHVNYEKESEDFAKKIVETSKNPVAVEFAKQIIEDFKSQEEAEGEEFDVSTEPEE